MGCDSCTRTDAGSGSSAEPVGDGVCDGVADADRVLLPVADPEGVVLGAAPADSVADGDAVELDVRVPGGVLVGVPLMGLGVGDDEYGSSVTGYV
jgi:hypothetical protein